MAQLTETVRNNADNAIQASTLALNATDLAERGNDVVSTMIGTIEKISDSSARIAEITGVIEGIAFQTNILALNAAVEAARAGDQGRGFVVVASEVRNLAQHSATAAKEIKSLVGDSVAVVEHGASQAADAGTTIGPVKDAIRCVADIVSEISWRLKSKASASSMSTPASVRWTGPRNKTRLHRIYSPVSGIAHPYARRHVEHRH